MNRGQITATSTTARGSNARGDESSCSRRTPSESHDARALAGMNHASPQLVEGKGGIWLQDPHGGEDPEPKLRNGTGIKPELGTSETQQVADSGPQKH